MQNRFTACIVAAGRGERAGGGTPKQFRLLGGQPMLAWSLARFDAHPACEHIVVAVADENRECVQELGRDLLTRLTLVTGGETRTRSVANGLAAVKSDSVLIHDAARPGLSAGLIDRLLEALKTADGAVPVLPVADALVRLGKTGLEPVSRDDLARVQTPQAFNSKRLRQAFEFAREQDYPDESALARAQGLQVVAVPGEERNFKVTWPEDFERMEAIVNPSSGITVSGTGYDVHRLEPGGGVMLCGVVVDCALRLVGHSDADAALHALTDALLGACGRGDIGQHFPPSDNRWKGADSAGFLRHALKLARETGAVPVHADLTVICERPKIGPHREAMRGRVAELLELPASRVNIKATTTEKLGFTGRGEGLAAHAIVTVRLS